MEELMTGGIVIDGYVFAGRWSNDWALQNTVEHDSEGIYFFNPIPPGFYTPRDKRWENVWAYVGIPQGYIHNIDEDPNWRKEWADFTEILIEVRYDGTIWYTKQIVHNSDFELGNFDIFSFLLNEMCDRIDEYMNGRPNDE